MAKTSAKKSTRKAVKKISVSEITPEVTGAVTRSEQLAIEHKGRLSMFAASLDREIDRIKMESCVRLGHATTINESSLNDAMVTLLTEYRDEYLTLSK